MPRCEGMENRFRNLSAIQNCLEIAAIIQRVADQTLPGLEQDRHQHASDKFRNEAVTLALADLQQSSHGHTDCSTAKTAETAH